MRNCGFSNTLSSIAQCEEINQLREKKNAVLHEVGDERIKSSFSMASSYLDKIESIKSWDP